MIDIRIKNISKNELPVYSHPGDAGFDFRANVSRTTVLPPLKRAIIPTGLFVDIPEGYEIQVRPRSGLAIKNGIIVLNTPGTIDSPYTGEICIILFNAGEEPFEINPGDRIAQGVLAKHEVANFIQVDEITKETERGEGGFGSTNVN